MSNISIKLCEQHSCTNFFTVGRKKKFCSKKCSDAAGRLYWKERNKEVFLASERKRKNKKYREDEAYRQKRIEASAKRYNSLSLEEKRALPKKKMPKEYHRSYHATRAANDPAFRLAGSLRARVRSAIVYQCGEKALHTIDLVGCSMKGLRSHLEQQFTEGMSWDNYGKWHIDHIRPCVSFDLTDKEEQKECFHYSNLQPLWAEENMQKGCSWND